jgi:DNA topoisomerase-3
MKVVLMVAEKPSLAASIAKILSRGAMTSRKSASPACQVHEYLGPFLDHSNVRFKMTSVCGHVMSLDFQGRYNNWEAVDPGELFQAPATKKEANPNLHIDKFLQQEGRNADYLVLWLDCDKEGENICFEVILIMEYLIKFYFHFHASLILSPDFLLPIGNQCSSARYKSSPIWRAGL